MKTYYIQDIRDEFIRLKEKQLYTPDDMLEIKNAHFTVDAPTIFGKINEEYIKAEIEWYESGSLVSQDLFKLYGKSVKVWQDVTGYDGIINSNYGWCIYSPDNWLQYNNVVAELDENPTSRRAVMYYTRPSMHGDAVDFGKNDHICTYAVHYSIDSITNQLIATVMMRSNDAIYGFTNDVAWQKHVLHKLANELELSPGPIQWFANSLHIYPRHHDLVSTKA